MMKIKVASIPAAGLTFQESLLPREIGLVEDFVNEEVPVSVDGFFEHVGEFVLAKIDVVCGVEDHCARCLERISRKVTFNYEIEFELGPTQEYIDVGDRIREELLLAHIPRTLCREDCKGICPDCGAELNTELCECKDKNK